MKFLLTPILFIYRIYAVIVFVFFLLILFPFFILVAITDKNKSGKNVYRLCSLWADCWFALVFIKTKILNTEKIEFTKPYIFVANHISYLDAPCVVKFIRQPIKPLGKIELSKIPLFGYIYKQVTITIDRTNAQSRYKSLMELKNKLEKGTSVLLFPEGTFNETSQPLKNFFNGAFKLAIEMQTPIKPFLLLDTYDRFSNRKFFALTPGLCRIEFLPEVSVEGYSINDIEKLREKVFAIMQQRLMEHKCKWIGNVE